MRSSVPQPRGISFPSRTNRRSVRLSTTEIFSMPLLFAHYGKALRIPNFGSRKSLDSKAERENRVSQCQTRRSGSQQGGQSVLVGTQLWDLNTRESLNTRVGCLSSLRYV